MDASHGPVTQTVRPSHDLSPLLSHAGSPAFPLIGAGGMMSSHFIESRGGLIGSFRVCVNTDLRDSLLAVDGIPCVMYRSQQIGKKANRGKRRSFACCILRFRYNGNGYGIARAGRSQRRRSMLTQPHREESLCRAYVQAVAAQAGLNFSWLAYDYGIDMTLRT